MASTSSPPAAEQRLLAALVFTDVVGFSARMQKEEANTLRHLERDFITMREFSALHDGTVIKTTGDGLLLCFTSAVQAVEWALRAQRHFAEQARTYAADEVLRHRIGIHLGDIIVKGDDVMGDSVNIAARVQTEAPAGGICISQAVYDVVKNKAKLHAIRLENRKLKNISETIPIYQLLLEPPKAAPVSTAATPRSARPEPETKSILPKAVGIVVLLLVLGGVATFFVRAHFEHERELARSRAEQEQLGAALRAKTDPGATAAAKSDPSPSPTGAAVDYLPLTTARPGTDGGAKESIRPLEAWLKDALPRYTRDQPLLVHQFRAAQPLTIFTDSSGQLYFAEGGATRRREWAELGPDIQGAIIVSALRSARPAVSREVIRGADAFAYVNGLPEMAKALSQERRSRNEPGK